MDMSESLDRALEASFRLDSGPAKEREINRLVIEVITRLVRETEPDAREVWLDWDQSGLAITSIHDGRGEAVIEPDEVDPFLQVYASNIQDSRHAPELFARRGIHGPFVLRV